MSMISEWEQYARDFQAGRKQEAVKAARLGLQRPQQTDWQWHVESLHDERNKWFVAAVFRKYPLPKRLFNPFLFAAIRETNPSLNRQFVEPCVESFGHRRVNEFLLHVVEGDDNTAIAGAVAALYWANMQIKFEGDVPAYTLEHATEESRAAFLELEDVWERKRQLFFKTFIENENVHLRRQILPCLNLKKREPGPVNDLVQQVVTIARQHPDDYIRHRVEVQLGNEHLLKPIPERSTDSDEAD